MGSQKLPKPAAPHCGGPEARERALVLLEAGYQLATIGREVGVTRQTVRAWRDSPEGQARMRASHAAREQQTAALREARGRATRLIAESLPDAIQALRDLLDHPDPVVRLRAAEALADRGGMARTTKLEATVRPPDVLDNLTDEELAQLEAIKAKMRPDGEP